MSVIIDIQLDKLIEGMFICQNGIKYMLQLQYPVSEIITYIHTNYKMNNIQQLSELLLHNILNDIIEENNEYLNELINILHHILKNFQIDKNKLKYISNKYIDDIEDYIDRLSFQENINDSWHHNQIIKLCSEKTKIKNELISLF